MRDRLARSESCAPPSPRSEFPREPPASTSRRAPMAIAPRRSMGAVVARRHRSWEPGRPVGSPRRADHSRRGSRLGSSRSRHLASGRAPTAAVSRIPRAGGRAARLSESSSSSRRCSCRVGCARGQRCPCFRATCDLTRFGKRRTLTAPPSLNSARVSLVVAWLVRRACLE